MRIISHIYIYIYIYICIYIYIYIYGAREGDDFNYDYVMGQAVVYDVIIRGHMNIRSNYNYYTSLYKMSMVYK